MGQSAAPTSLLIGSGHPSTGLFRVDFDSATGALGPAVPILHHPDLSFIVPAAQGDRLYGISAPPAGVVAMSIEPGTGKVSLLNKQPVEGGRPVPPDDRNQGTYRNRCDLQRWHHFRLPCAGQTVPSVHAQPAFNIGAQAPTRTDRTKLTPTPLRCLPTIASSTSATSDSTR